MPPDCPRCLRARRTLPERSVGRCHCGRYQFLYQLTFVTFGGATFKHLACVECAQGAWCRDFTRPEGAEPCAANAHKHEPGQCRSRI